MNTRALILKVAIFVMLSTAVACKKDQVDLQGAAITALQGSVSVTDNKGTKKTISPSSLYTKDGILMPGYAIQTGRDGQVDLQFSPTMKLRMGPDTTLKIESARILASKGFEQLQLRLEKGRVFLASEKLAAASRINVVTPTAIASVRGTEWVVKEENGKSQTMVKEGKVEVADDTLKDSQVVEENKKAEVQSDGKITVSTQTDSDKKEVADLGRDLASITENGRNEIQSLIQQFQEQKILIQQTIEEQKKSNEEIMQQQKDSNQQLMQDQHKKDLENLREQIQRDREEMDKLKSQLGADKDAMTQSGREEKDKISNQGRDEINQMKQNSPLSTQDQNKAELERLRKGQ